MRRYGRSAALAAAVILGLSALAGCGDRGSGAGQGSLAEVTGPIANGTRPNAFGAPVLDVEQSGYVVEEFFFAGEASAYAPEAGTELGADGFFRVAPTRTAPFKTRMLVLRPRDAARFSGTVWLSWMNVTAGFEVVDLQPGYLLDGDALVYVSAQKVGLDGVPGAEANGLRLWDPVRYGSLTHPGDDFSYDVFTHAARLVGPRRGDLATDPMGGLAVERVIASGISQSDFRLVSYVNGVQPLTAVPARAAARALPEPRGLPRGLRRGGRPGRGGRLLPRARRQRRQESRGDGRVRAVPGLTDASRQVARTRLHAGRDHLVEALDQRTPALPDVDVSGRGEPAERHPRQRVALEGRTSSAAPALEDGDDLLLERAEADHQLFARKTRLRRQDRADLSEHPAVVALLAQPAQHGVQAHERWLRGRPLAQAL
jgi:hypothetical protein